MAARRWGESRIWSVTKPFERDWKMTRTAKNSIGPVGRGILDKDRIDEAAGQGRQRDLTLDAGQGRTDAVMHPAAEAEVLVVRPIRPESVRFGKPLRIPIGRGEEKAQSGSLGDGDAIEFDVGQGKPVEELHRRFEAERFLDHDRGTVRIVAQSCEFFRIPE